MHTPVHWQLPFWYICTRLPVLRAGAERRQRLFVTDTWYGSTAMHAQGEGAVQMYRATPFSALPTLAILPKECSGVNPALLIPVGKVLGPAGNAAACSWRLSFHSILHDSGNWGATCKQDVLASVWHCGQRTLAAFGGYTLLWHHIAGKSICPPLHCSAAQERAESHSVQRGVD